MDCDPNKLDFQKFHNKIKLLKSTDVKPLNYLIDEINSSSPIFENLDKQIIEELLLDICKIIPSGNDHILSKLCSLVYIFAYKHKVLFSTPCLQHIVKYLCDMIKLCGAWVLNDVLVSLSAVLYQNAGNLEMFHKELVGANGVLIDLMTTKKYELSVNYNAVLCLKSLLMRKQGEAFLSDSLLENCCRKCVYILKENRDCTTDVMGIKLLICALKCLQLLILSKVATDSSLGEILGILKYLSYFGLPGQTSVVDLHLYPTLVFPITLQTQNDHYSDSVSSVHPKLRKQKKNRRSKVKKKVQTKNDSGADPSEDESDSKTNSMPASPVTHNSYRNNWNKTSSSDSEFSDAESQITKAKHLQVAARQHAYEALHAILKTTDKKLMFGYWSSFFPDFPAIPAAPYGQNIFTSILKDPSPQVRFCALSLVTEMLRGSKQFLSLADGRNLGHISFTSLSSILASMINELHRNLLLVLLSEKSTSLLTQVLKCYAVLVENVPYRKLNNDILNKLLKHLLPFLQNKDTQVQVACLSVFTSLLNSDQLPEDIANQVLRSNLQTVDCTEAESPDETHPKSPETQLPWLFCLCRTNVLKDVPLPIRLESVQLINSIVGKYFNTLLFHVPIIEEIILFCINENDTSLQLHGAKLLEVLGRYIMNDITKPDSGCEAQISSSAVFHLWQNVFSSPLIACSSDNSQTTLQSVCCDCLSTIPSNVFEEFDVKVHICCITLLLGLAYDPNPNVRGAAIRCLGVFALFPCFKQDLSFLSHVAEVLVKAGTDSNLNVRLKASWAFGNLSDALFLNREESSFENVISVNFFCTTGMACIQFSTDCDRVRANAVRALGNFLRYLPDTYMEQPLVQDFAVKSCVSLKNALGASNVKVRWNSCYALGNLFRNTALIASKILNVDELLKCLINALKSPNFKVRISAAQTLTLLPARVYYSDLFPKIWLELVASLHSAVEDVNFKEIKHQENLCDQICYGICQIASFMSYEDASLIANDSLKASEILFTSMWKFGKRTKEDKIVCSASEHISTLIKMEDNSSDVKQLLEILQDIFSQAKMAFHEEN